MTLLQDRELKKVVQWLSRTKGMGKEVTHERMALFATSFWRAICIHVIIPHEHDFSKYLYLVLISPFGSTLYSLSTHFEIIS